MIAIRPLTVRSTLAVAATTALVLAACGSDDDSADEPATTEAAADTMPMDDMDDMNMDDMDMDDMNMGDADATPADDVEGAALARGEFVLMDTRPAGYDDLEGTAVIARSTMGTTVTTELTGLLPNVAYISHLHAQPCDDDNAGPHYQFEVGGSEFPPNEIHLAFTSDNDGNGFMTAENAQVAGEDAVAFVVHPQEFIDNKIACVDFVADDPEAVASAIANGATESANHDMSDMGGMDDMDHDGDEMDSGEMDSDEMKMDDADHGDGEQPADGTDELHGDHHDHVGEEVTE